MPWAGSFASRMATQVWRFAISTQSLVVAAVRMAGTDGDAVADGPEKGLSVYRLMPSLSDYQTLSLNNFDVRGLMRWQRAGGEADRPMRLRAEWLGERRWSRASFPLVTTVLPC